MGRNSTLKWLTFLLVFAAAAAVLVGCQKSTSEASETSTEEAQVEVNEAEELPPATAPAPAAAPTPPVPQPATAPEPPSQPVLAETVKPAPDPPKAVLVTVPTGTILVVKLDKSLSSHTSQVGENFRAFLAQDVAAEGAIALPKDTIVIGRVTEASPAKKIGGRARLSLEFYSLHLATGQQAPLQAVFAGAGKSQNTKDAAIIGGSTLGGAVIGGAVNKGEGTAIGAIVGGLAGAAIAHETKGKPVELPVGTTLTLEMTQPVTVELL